MPSPCSFRIARVGARLPHRTYRSPVIRGEGTRVGKGDGRTKPSLWRRERR
jgi:hypothetical protein